MIDVTRNATHIIAFPSYVASSMGQYGHVINLVMQGSTDNGTLSGKGSYVKFEQYNAAAVADNKVEGVIREAAAEGGWYVEFTKLDVQYYFVYNTPKSPYPEVELRDEALFYNAAGDVTQGMELHLGDIVTLSDSAFSTLDPAEGKTVKYSAGKYVVQP